METFSFREGAFEMGPGWVDESIQILRFPDRGGMTISRAPHQGRSLAECLDAATSGPRQRLRHLVEGPRASLEVGHLRAESIEWCFDVRGEVQFQRVVVVLLGAEMLTFVVTGPAGEKARLVSHFEAALASMRFRKAGVS
jgi:hypothetical protein